MDVDTFTYEDACWSNGQTSHRRRNHPSSHVLRSLRSEKKDEAADVALWIAEPTDERALFDLGQHVG